MKPVYVIFQSASVKFKTHDADLQIRIQIIMSIFPIKIDTELLQIFILKLRNSIFIQCKNNEVFHLGFL